MGQNEIGNIFYQPKEGTKGGRIWNPPLRLAGCVVDVGAAHYVSQTFLIAR